MNSIRIGDITVSVQRELIDVTTDWTPTPNEQWRYTDREGHAHRYEHGYPTLDYVVDEQHWCDGTEGYSRHDPHMTVDKAHYECKLCGEVIEPTMDPPGTPKFITGSMSGEIEGTRSDGMWVRAWLRADEFPALQEITQTGAGAQEFIDALPDDRIIEMRFSS